MSILSRLGANRHWDDDALLEIWAAATSTTDPHLTSCAHCRARFASIDTWLDDLRTELQATMDRAPWLGSAQRAPVLDAVATVRQAAVDRVPLDDFVTAVAVAADAVRATFALD